MKTTIPTNHLAVIFDMDGVLVDSYRAHWQSWRFMAGEVGRELTEEQFLRAFGRTSREIIAEHWGADVTRGKPDPQVFLTAAARLGVEPRHCAVIEDAPVGIAAANAAGMTSIALLSTGHTRERSAAARLIVESLRELSAPRIHRLVDARRDG